MVISSIGRVTRIGNPDVTAFLEGFTRLQPNTFCGMLVPAGTLKASQTQYQPGRIPPYEVKRILAMHSRALHPMLLCIFVGALLLNNFVRGGLDGHCPPLGPVLPAPKSPSLNPNVQAAGSNFSTYFSALTSSFLGSAASVAVASIHEDGKLLDLHHTPQIRQTGSTNSVNGDTIYRVGSISKVFTTIGTLQAGIRMDDPILDYLPELQTLQADDGFSVDWNDVTVGSLASREYSGFWAQDPKLAGVGVLTWIHKYLGRRY